MFITISDKSSLQPAQKSKNSNKTTKQMRINSSFMNIIKNSTGFYSIGFGFSLEVFSIKFSVFVIPLVFFITNNEKSIKMI